MFQRFMKAGLYFDKDDGAGTTPENDTEDKNEGKKADGLDQKSEDEKKDGKAKAEDKKFTQAEVDQIIKDRLTRESKRSEEKADQARRQAEEEALTKNNEFQKLAEKRQQTITELETQVKDLTPIKEQAEKYKSALDKYLTEAKKTLPKLVLPLVENLDIVDALEYITANAKELGVTIAGIPETPKEKDSKKMTDEQKKQASTTAQNLIHKNF